MKTRITKSKLIAISAIGIILGLAGHGLFLHSIHSLNPQ